MPSIRLPSRPMTTVEVDSADVVRLMLQFMKENRLFASMRQLQEETGVSLNTVQSVEQFMADISNGKWDAVLHELASIELPKDKLFAVYEQVVLELLEQRETAVAKELMRQSPAFELMRKEAPEQFRRLVLLANRGAFDHREAYPDGATKEKRRADLAQQLRNEVGRLPAPPAARLAHVARSPSAQRRAGVPHAHARDTRAEVAATGGACGAARALLRAPSPVHPVGARACCPRARRSTCSRAHRRSTARSRTGPSSGWYARDASGAGRGHPPAPLTEPAYPRGSRAQ